MTAADTAYIAVIRGGLHIDVADDTVIAMTPGTYAIFTPADGHRCLCAPDGQGKAIKKAILKLHV